MKRSDINHYVFTAEKCVISTANDELRDNFFVNPDISRFGGVEEDEPQHLNSRAIL